VQGVRASVDPGLDSLWDHPQLVVGVDSTSDAAGFFEIRWSTAQLSNGEYFLLVVATDRTPQRNVSADTLRVTISNP
jgi:hypothetical protein